MLSRFRGTYTGAILGQMWASHAASLPKTALWLLECHLDFRESSATNPFGNFRGIEEVSKILVEKGELSLDGNKNISIPWLEEETAQLDADIWMGLLPITLFFHENNSRLAVNLQQATTSWQFSSEATEAALGVGYTIALALRETLDPATLLPQTLQFLNAIEGDSLPLQFPSTLQTLLDRPASLESVKGGSPSGSQSLPRPTAQICSRAVALALYCFLGTPQDFRTCVMRSLQVDYHPELVATIVGAIAGAYNGYAGIPLSWRVALNLEGESTSDRLATQLWAAWSGRYDPTGSLDMLEEIAAVTAPGVLRPRALEVD
ncbi:MAG: ADP-ribosylglycohydrolase family protein [Cyanobacteriota bacterium]|nr:ADP-ribosylglycohydrolase family protein [Cyanobacteriota bacterium]